MQHYVAPLDLSGVDLSRPSGQKLRADKTWTLLLVLKLALPVMLSIARRGSVTVPGGRKGR